MTTVLEAVQGRAIRIIETSGLGVTHVFGKSASLACGHERKFGVCARDTETT